MLKSYHVGIILVGSIFEPLSEYGKSPSDTYVTFLVDKIYPIEEIIGQLWNRPNSASLHLIKRIDGRDICEKWAYKVLTEHLNRDKYPYIYTVYLAIMAYFRRGEIIDDPSEYGWRYNLCSTFIGHILLELGILRKDAITTNLLPIDFYDLHFYQKYKYKRIKLFDKQTYTYDWLFTVLLQRFGQLEFHPIKNKFVDKMLENYDYPRDPNVKLPNMF